MKKIYALSIGILLTLLTTSQTYSQFQEAQLTEFPAFTSPVTVSNTGNDILDVGSTTYQVSVWDDNAINAGLSWRVGTSSAHITFSQLTDVIDPDVCLLKNASGIVYAVAAYFVAGTTNSFYWEYFEWDNVAQSFNSAGSFMLIPGFYGHTVNIDANDQGDFAITWDDQTQTVFIIAGHTPAAGVPTLYMSGSPLIIGNGNYPDLCLYRNAAGDNQVDLTYIGLNGQIEVEIHRILDLSVGNVNGTSAFHSGPPNLQYFYPRIACPKYNSGTASDWTVVAEDNDQSSEWYIRGFNANGLVSPPLSQYIYNDGGSSGSAYNLVNYPCLRPVVAYDASYKIWVGWGIDNSLGLINSIGAPAGCVFPVSVICDRKAHIYPGQEYYIVPTNITPNFTYNVLSLSGRNSIYNLFTWNNSQQSEIYTKTVDHSPAPQSLRSLNSSNYFFEWLNLVMLTPGNNDPVLYIKIFDLSGRQVFHFNGNTSDVLNSVNSFSQNNPECIYLVNVLSDTNKFLFTGKTFLGQ